MEINLHIALAFGPDQRLGSTRRLPLRPHRCRGHGARWLCAGPEGSSRWASSQRSMLCARGGAWEPYSWTDSTHRVAVDITAFMSLRIHRTLPPLIAATLSGMILLAAPAVSGPRSGRCSGELSRLPEGEWVIRTGREGICTFHGEDIKTKVLAVCSEGQGCEVTGLLGDCEEGECSEIRSVRSVRPVRRPTRGR